jgi:predicted  nucleic acid-binding Zn-ribbon protein
MNTDKKVFEKLFSGEKVELESQAYEFALDIKGESKKIDDLFSKSSQLRSQVLKDATSKLNTSVKSMVDIRASLSREMSDFKTKYKELTGDNPDSTQQVKNFNLAIQRADSQINEISQSIAEISRFI